ncbi:MAG: class I SAM-dependent RNA methyltransferase [Acidobacteria bacterium]|nr:class I SAM-dependent RNA methyltransferase [Acidobacteriota bacterium]MCW5949948.1 class I SAM-dependent RNA methyltransferase [Pyrinomonadaceae bacterium]
MTADPAAAKYSVGDEIELTIERIVPRGLGLAFADGLTVFVRLAAPSDRVKVRLDEVRGRTAFGSISEIIEAGPGRRVPPCRHYGICGGCDMQHLTYEAQLAAKASIVEDCLRRLGKIESGPIAIEPGPAELRYRTRARWHVDLAHNAVGYLRFGSHEAVNVTECPVLADELADAMSEIRRDAETGRFLNEKAEVDAASGSDGVSLWSPHLATAVKDVSADIGGLRYEYSAQVFFQGNAGAVPRLVELAIGGLSGTSALDLYCGVGLLTLPLATTFDEVTGVESSRTSVEFARRNADRAGLGNVELRCETAIRYLDAAAGSRPDLVVLDPPRSGTERGVIEALIDVRPKQISYVSCEPSMLARDLRKLLDGGYRIDGITAIDLFPQTHHVETVARLSDMQL